jgi:hypothetical protein
MCAEGIGDCFLSGMLCASNPTSMLWSDIITRAEDGGSMFLRNVSAHTLLQPRRPTFISPSPLRTLNKKLLYFIS